MAAGWEVQKVDLARESVVFVRMDGVSLERGIRTDSTPAYGERFVGSQSLSAENADVIDLLGYEFVHAAAVDPERGADGALLEFMPQSRYAHADTTRLNRHGEGPFCRFDVLGLPPTSGVYAVTVDDELAYVGKAVDLARRWGPTGYATISPVNCYVGGQSTNCKVNHFVLLAARADRRVDLWIHESTDPAPIEARLIGQLDPPWNGHRPRAVTVPKDTGTAVPRRSRRDEPAQAGSSDSPAAQAAKGSGCLAAVFVTGLSRLLRLFR